MIIITIIRILLPKVGHIGSLRPRVSAYRA